jgi:hypothetical protein
VLTKLDAESGERMNLSFINVVVIDQNPNRSRTYFSKPYVSGENQVPECYSSDGKRPDKDVATPCAATCDSCPNAVKGSRIKEGREGYACESKKRLAVWPAAMLGKPAQELPVMQMILPMTSIWDKENKQNDAEGWFAWDNYVAYLRSMGVTHTCQLVTRIKFDNTEYPKLLFKAVRYLDDAEHAQFRELDRVKPMVKSPEVQKLLHGRLYEEPAEGAAAVAKPKAQDDGDDGFSSAAELAAMKAKASAKADADAQAEAAAQAAAKAKAEKAAAAAAKKAESAKASAAEPTKAAAPVAEVKTASPGLAALAAEWE